MSQSTSMTYRFSTLIRMTNTDAFLESIPCGNPCEDCPARGLPLGELIVVDLAVKNIKPDNIGQGDRPSERTIDFVESTLQVAPEGERITPDPTKVQNISQAVLRVTKDECPNY